MNANILSTALLAAVLALPAAASAQMKDETRASDSKAPAANAPATGSTRPGDQGSESKRCNTMSGAEKDQCVQDENAKTDSKAAPETAGAGSNAPRTSDSAGEGGREKSGTTPD
jgi:hypothetical protein